MLAKAGIFSRLGWSPNTRPDVTVAEMIVRAEAVSYTHLTLPTTPYV